MGTKEDLFTINQIKHIPQIHKQPIKNFLNSTFEQINKKNQWLINWGKHWTEKWSSWAKEIPTVSCWSVGKKFQNLDSSKNELLQNKKDQ